MRRFVSASRAWTAIFGKLYLREPQLALLFLCIPACFILLYWQAFGSGSSGFSSSLTAIVVARSTEEGSSRAELASSPPPPTSLASRLAQAMREEEFEGRPALSVYESVDLEAALTALRSGQASIVVDARDEEGGAELPCYSDAASSLGAYAQSFVRAALAKTFPDELGGRLRTDYAFSRGSGTNRDFLVALPGLLVFGWIFGVLSTALLLSREVSRRSLDRVALSGSGAGPIAFGLWLSLSALGLGQAIIAFAAAALTGYPIPANPGDGLLAVLILNPIIALCSVACGVATAAFASSESAAVNLSMVFIAPLAFLSGAVFELPLAPVASLFGLPLRPNAFLPSTPATEALLEILVRGASLASQWPRLLIATAVSIALAALAALAFGARRLGRTRKGNIA